MIRIASIAALTLASSLVSAFEDDGRLEGFREDVENLRRRVRSVEFTSDAEGWTVGDNVGSVQYMRERVAISGRSRYIETRHKEPFGFECDPHVSLEILSNTQLTLFNPFFRTGVVSTAVDVRQNPKLNPIYYEPFIAMSGWWPSDTDPSYAVIPPASTSLHINLESPNISIVGDVENINGRECVKLVLKSLPYSETIWLDKDHPHILVKRWTHKQGAETHIIFVNSDHKEVVPGVWLPMRQRRVVHTGPTPDETPEDAALLNWFERRIDSFKVNAVESQMFNFNGPAGSILLDFESQRTKLLPGGKCIMDNAVKIHQMVVARRKQSGTANSSLHLIGLNLTVLVAILMLRLSPSWRRKLQ